MKKKGMLHDTGKPYTEWRVGGNSASSQRISISFYSVYISWSMLVGWDAFLRLVCAHWKKKINANKKWKNCSFQIRQPRVWAWVCQRAIQWRKKKHHCACLAVRQNAMFETAAHDSRVAPPVETMSPHLKQCSHSKIHLFVFSLSCIYIQITVPVCKIIICIDSIHILGWTQIVTQSVIGSKSHTWVRAKYYFGTSESQQRCLIFNILLIFKVISNTITQVSKLKVVFPKN